MSSKSFTHPEISDGREIPVADKITFEERATIERAEGCGMSKMPESYTGMARIFISLRRAGIAFTWEDMKTLSDDDFTFYKNGKPLSDDELEKLDEPDPTPADAEVGPKRKSPSSKNA